MGKDAVNSEKLSCEASSASTLESLANLVKFSLILMIINFNSSQKIKNQIKNQSPYGRRHRTEKELPLVALYT